MDNRTIRLSDAIEAVKAERVSGETETESDDAYNLGIAHAIAALSALPAVEGWLAKGAKAGPDYLVWCECETSKSRWVEVAYIERDGRWYSEGSGFIPVKGFMPLPAPPIE